MTAPVLRRPVPHRTRRNCDVPGCGSHRGNRRRGPHWFAELVVPEPGRVAAVVYCHLDVDGSRGADLAAWDGARWTAEQLPDDPPPELADAVGWGRKFLTGITP